MSVSISSLTIKRLVRRPSESAIQEMAQSLDSIGQLSPIGITSEKEVVFGVTRLLAAKKLGWNEILARELPNCEPAEAFRMSVSENTVRSQMTFAELADAIHQYSQLTGLPLRKAGQDLGYKQSHVSKCLSTDERLTPENKKRLLDAGVAGSVAYLYSQLPEPEQSELITEGLRNKWTRKDLEKRFRQQRHGTVRLDYKTARGKALLEVPKNASPEDLLNLVKAFHGEITKCLKEGFTLPTMARILKEQSNA